MAAYGPAVGGVTRDDVLQSTRKIKLESASDYDEPIDSRHIGSRFNQWRKPVADWGNNKAGWEVKLKSSPYVGDIEFSKKQWSLARSVVDGVLDLLLKEVQAISSSYEGLKVERYVRQGSAREGLKVIAPDEFDTILQFHFEGLSLKPVMFKKSGAMISEFCYLEVNQSMEVLQRRLPRLCKAGAFYQDGSRVLINARMMHEGVFKSIIDKASDNVISKVKDSLRSEEQVFRLTRKINPPSINITIHLNEKATGYFRQQGSIPNPQSDMTTIDLDIVPGLVIGNDQVSDPSHPGQTMDCPVYAVFKWVEGSSMKAADFPKPDIVWRISSSGIEKHTLDLVRSERKQLYIITAMRVLKTYFVKTKNASSTPPQIGTVLKSYHLKHIAFYIILYTCYIYPDAKIFGVEDALKYFFAFLRESLEKKRLPHFFHSNPLINKMYPTYKPTTDQLRFNLLRNKSDESLNQAKLSLDNHLLPDLRFDGNPVYTFGWLSDDDEYGGHSVGGFGGTRSSGNRGADDIDAKLEKIKREYSHGISVGMFF